MGLAIRIELANLVAVQGPDDADAREHRRTAGSRRRVFLCTSERRRRPHLGFDLQAIVLALPGHAYGP
jgi:hypothetical protein